MPCEIELQVVQYPGRPDGDLLDTVADFMDLADRVVAALSQDTTPPIALFGHSMGATVAYEVARRMEPVQLFVAAGRAPSDPAPEYLDFPTDELLVDFVRFLGGSGSLAMRYPNMRAAAIPALRHDLNLLKSYRYQPGSRLACPITVLRGVDDPLLDADGANRWGDHADSAFEVQSFPGGHFFIEGLREEVVACLVDELGRRNKGEVTTCRRHPENSEM